MDRNYFDSTHTQGIVHGDKNEVTVHKVFNLI